MRCGHKSKFWGIIPPPICNELCNVDYKLHSVIKTAKKKTNIKTRTATRSCLTRKRAVHVYSLLARCRCGTARTGIAMLLLLLLLLRVNLVINN